jgi:hypothetical protein
LGHLLADVIGASSALQHIHSPWFVHSHVFSKRPGCCWWLARRGTSLKYSVKLLLAESRAIDRSERDKTRRKMGANAARKTKRLRSPLAALVSDRSTATQSASTSKGPRKKPTYGSESLEQTMTTTSAPPQ